MHQIEMMKQYTEEYPSQNELELALEGLEFKDNYMYLGRFESYEEAVEGLNRMGAYSIPLKLERGDLKLLSHNGIIYCMLYMWD